MNKTLMKYLIGISGILVIIAAALGGWYFKSKAWHFRLSYKQLQIGMPFHQVHYFFEREPDYLCYFQNCTVVYYFSNSKSPLIPDVANLPQHIVNKEDIPFIPGAAQLLLASYDQLIAHTINGKAEKVTTKYGDFSGDNLTCLDDELFKNIELNWVLELMQRLKDDSNNFLIFDPAIEQLVKYGGIASSHLLAEVEQTSGATFRHYVEALAGIPSEARDVAFLKMLLNYQEQERKRDIRDWAPSANLMIESLMNNLSEQTISALKSLARDPNANMINISAMLALNNADLELQARSPEEFITIEDSLQSTLHSGDFKEGAGVMIALADQAASYLSPSMMVLDSVTSQSLKEFSELNDYRSIELFFGDIHGLRDGIASRKIVYHFKGRFLEPNTHWMITVCLLYPHYAVTLTSINYDTPWVRHHYGQLTKRNARWIVMAWYDRYAMY